MGSFRMVVLGSLTVSAVALAHAALTSPTPRNPDNGIKTGPCGPYPKMAPVAKFTPGQTITVKWTEAIAHPGYYRIAYSPGSDTDFDSHVLKNNIANPAGAQATNSTQITLPNITCDNCTLQLIQVMTNTSPPSNYYSCADIAIQTPDAGSPTDAGVTDAGVKLDAGSIEPDAGSTEPDAGVVAEDGGAEDDAGSSDEDAGSTVSGEPDAGLAVADADGGGELVREAVGGCGATGAAPALLLAVGAAALLRRRNQRARC